MSYFTGFIRLMILPAILLAAVPCANAEKSSDLIGKLDDLDRAVAESKELNNRAGNTIDELRKNLYQSAVKMRDLKKLSDEVHSTESSDAVIKKQQELLRTEISQATASIRLVNNQLLELEKIYKASTKRIEDDEEEIAALKDLVVDPEKAAEAVGKKKMASLQAKLKESTDLVKEQEDVIEKLNREIQALNKGKVAAPPTAKSRANSTEEKMLGSAKKLLDAGNVDEAIAQFNKVMYENPDSDEARLGLAACYFERGEMGTAQGLIDEVLSRNKSNAWAIGLQGAVFYREGKLRDARRALEKSVKLDDTNAYTHNYLGVVLFESGKKADGIESVKKSIQLDSEFVPALYNLAVMMTSAEVPDLDASRFYYEKALSLGSPRDPLMDQLLNISP